MALEIKGMKRVFKMRKNSKEISSSFYHTVFGKRCQNSDDIVCSLLSNVAYPKVIYKDASA